MDRISVLGPGGVGGFVAAALARAGEAVTVVARASTVTVIARDGIRVSSVALGEFVARPSATAELNEPIDVLFITTKATALDAALDRITTTPGLVIPLLNGLDHLETLRRRFGSDSVCAGVIRIEADRPEPGRVIQKSPSVRVDLASDQPRLAARLPGLATALTAAGVPTQIGAAESQVMWSKLVRLNALASTTSVADISLGSIRDDPTWRRALIGCVEEGAAVAAAEGASIDPAETLAELQHAHRGLGSSMQRDLAAGRAPELDAIQGSVLRAAVRHRIACPTITRLSAQIAERAGIAPPRI